MRTRPLDRKLLWGVVAIVVIPTALAEAVLIVLYRRGVFQDTWGLLLSVLIGLPALMAYLGWTAYAISRPLARTMKMICDGSELMSTVNPDHRIQVRTGDELEALADGHQPTRRPSPRCRAWRGGPRRRRHTRAAS